MSDQGSVSPGRETDLSEAPPRYSRQERRAERRSSRDPGLRWVGGLLLIGLGVLFLLQGQGYLEGLTNWWALFLLIPSGAALSAALRTYRREGSTWTREALASMIGAVLVAGLMLILLFDLSLSIFGPVLLIGAGMLVVFGPR